jgi:ABC-type uncharacterized transport system auxiliary subunit
MGAARRPFSVAAIAVTALASVALLAGCGEEEETFSNKRIVDSLRLEETESGYAIDGDPFCEVSKQLLNDSSEVDDAGDGEQLVISSSEGNVGVEGIAPFAPDCKNEAKQGLNELDPKPKEE